ncbi:MAG: formimidoylglutamate deiminase [Proteobacteria bacterium]|nr:formimidoylglutamate deiminase [Pseudomonadota bacterium]
MRADTAYFAPQAWVDGAWAFDVRLDVAADGTWRAITPQGSARGATVLDGPVLPGIVNAHSHAFQRAIAGLTEQGSGTDDFWSWRDRMYRAALRITPAQLEAIATQLYAELLAGGYTQVCEFHYLHNDVDGRAYADPLEMSLALVRAAQATGIGLTLLPTLYMRSGFGAAGLRDDQRRFAGTPASVLRMAESINALRLPRINAGIALHSLRAVDPGALAEVAQAAKAAGWPVHIHIAEQVQEVNDCLAHHGQRPIEWLLDHASLDARWNLVHATHTTPQELQGLRAAAASVVICPSTEANLGDGVFDYPGWAGQGGCWSIGSDSHVTRRATEELRLLEYSQRLTRRQRNIAAQAGGGGSSAAWLLQGALHGGSAAAGQPLGGLRAGQRADFCVLEAQAPSLAGMAPVHVLDAVVFSSPDAGVAAVHVAGLAGAALHARTQSAFASAMQALWA